MNGPIARRTLFRGALAGIGAAALGGCSSPVGAGIANTPLDPGTVAVLEPVRRRRRRPHADRCRTATARPIPNIPLQAVTLAWGNPYYTKLSLATRRRQAAERRGRRT